MAFVSLVVNKGESMTQTYDAIVIGAGVMGASIAFHLAERGLKVAILERKVTASGATGHSSGLVRMHYDLAAESARACGQHRVLLETGRAPGGPEVHHHGTAAQ